MKSNDGILDEREQLMIADLPVQILKTIKGQLVPDIPVPKVGEGELVPFQPTSIDKRAQSLKNEVEAQIALLAGDSSVTFWVAPVDHWVQSSSSWTPGATILMTIQDGGVVVYSDSQTADTNGNFNFNLWNKFDLQRGQVVTVSDGTTTKTHTVMPLYVDGVDVTADTIFGRADAGTTVDIWVHGNGGMTVTPDSSGNWTADFSGTTDVTYLSDGASRQSDIDGDSTWVWWASPKFQVSPVHNWVQSSRPWTPGATITLTIEDGGVVLYSDSQTADADGNFNFNLWDVFDLQRGQVVTVSDGTHIKTHTVMPLYVDGVDVTADTIIGRADAGTTVDIWVHGNGGMTIRSYREYAIRYAELGTVYRYERSGVLHGLLRVRGVTQDDAHVFCREDQIEEEIQQVLNFTVFVLTTFGFHEYDIFLSTRPEKYVGTPESWERATGALELALKKRNLPYQIDEGGGAFYGPKIDIKIKDALNRAWQCSTIQVDFNNPERFDVTYRGSDGREHRPIMIHRE